MPRFYNTQSRPRMIRYAREMPRRPVHERRLRVNMPARHDLGAPGIEYVRWSLSTSPMTLAALLLQQLPLDGGQAFTFRPEQVDPSRLADFHDGVFGQVGASQVLAWTFDF